MTTVMDECEKGHAYMQEIMRIGNEFVQADDDIKDIGHASTEVHDIAHKYKTDMLAVIGKGDHNIVTQYHNQTPTLLGEDIVKTISLIHAMADAYNVDAINIADAIKNVIDTGVLDDEE